MVKRECNSAHQARQTGFYGGHTVQGARSASQQEIGQHAYFFSPMTPLWRGADISASFISRYSRSTSSVCCPSSGAGSRTLPGVSESFTGTPTNLTLPATRVVPLDDHPRACTCG